MVGLNTTPPCPTRKSPPSWQPCRSAEVSLPTGRARVRWQAGSDGKVDGLLDAVAGAGYEAKPVLVDSEPKKPAPLSGWRFNVVVGLAGTLPLMAGEKPVK